MSSSLSEESPLKEGPSAEGPSAEGPSLSESLNDRLSILVDAKQDTSKKVSTSNDLVDKWLPPVDAHIEIPSKNPGEKGESYLQLPPLEWNPHFRKAYSILMWIRPVVHTDEQISEHPSLTGAAKERLLYQFSTAPGNEGVGICATLGQWKLRTDTSEQGNKSYYLEANLTIFALPSLSVAQALQRQLPPPKAGSFTVTKLRLPCNASSNSDGTHQEHPWSLVGISHTFPYLKRPQWTLVVNGIVQESEEMGYPTISGDGSMMSFCRLCQNAFFGGARHVVEQVNEKEDVEKTATQLSSSADQMATAVFYKVVLHLASLSIYPDAIPPLLQQVLFDAGPLHSQQCFGRIITSLSPTAYIPRGRTLGMPLQVLPDAIEWQRLAGRVLLHYTATHTRILPNRLWSPSLHTMSMGFTENIPKVGLVQPSAPLSGMTIEAAQAQFGMSVHCQDAKLIHTTSQYLTTLAHPPRHLDNNVPLQQWSLLMSEVGLLPRILLPLHLALVPPAFDAGLHQELYIESLTQLYHLLSEEGAYLANLIRLLSRAIHTGGPRVWDEILEQGMLHSLGSLLRRVLLRGSALGLLSSPNGSNNNGVGRAKKKELSFASVDDFIRHVQRNIPRESYDKSVLDEKSSRGSGISPSRIPLLVIDACRLLIQSCCMGSHAPNPVRRGSDLALTAVFAFALDWDIWGRSLMGTQMICEVLHTQYGLDRDGGALLRSQINVQYFLDVVRISIPSIISQQQQQQERTLEQIGNSLASLLHVMLLASLSNRKIIRHGEQDVLACVGLLCDCPLGSLGTHVVLGALTKLLQWCNVLPHDGDAEPKSSLEIASRLGRNLLMVQFHDVVIPMLLSRTVFCGNPGKKGAGQMDWKNHWRMALTVFSWVASIAGSEGDIASMSTGRLLLASGLAGSLDGVLMSTDGTEIARFLTGMFFPPPAVGHGVDPSAGASGGNYASVLNDRLRVTTPLLPGLVASLVSQVKDDPEAAEEAASTSVAVLGDIVATVSVAFHRVHASGNLLAQHRNKRWGRDAISAAYLKAVREHIPSLLAVACILYEPIQKWRAVLKKSDADEVALPSWNIFKENNSGKLLDSDMSEWVDIAPSSQEKSNAGTSSTPSSDQSMLSKLLVCQDSVLRTVCDLLINAMKYGVGEAATAVWRVVTTSLMQFCVNGSLQAADESAAAEAATSERSVTKAKNEKAVVSPKVQNLLCSIAGILLGNIVGREAEDVAVETTWSPEMCNSISRLCNLIEEKELLHKPIGSTYHEVDSAEGSGLSISVYSSDQIRLVWSLLALMVVGRDSMGWCQLNLPSPPTSPKSTSDTENLEAPSPMSEYVNNALVPHEKVLYHSNESSAGDVSAQIDALSSAGASKVLLPILLPCLRVLIDSIASIRSDIAALIPSPPQPSPDETEGSSNETEVSTPSSKKVSLLSLLVTELRHSLTAAIVGLTFTNARDLALHALASLRVATVCHRNANDANALQLCSLLFIAVVEEIRVRYDGERRLRAKALFDAYEDDNMEELHFPDGSHNEHDAEWSRGVERMILGGDIIPDSTSVESVDRKQSRTEANAAESAHSEEDLEVRSHASNEKSGSRKGSEDFILFHEALDIRAERRSTLMGWHHYKGLGSALEKCNEGVQVIQEEGDTSSTSLEETSALRLEILLPILTPYLDKWDENAASEAADSELVDLFDDRSASVSDGTSYGTQHGLTNYSLSLAYAFNGGDQPASMSVDGSDNAADAMTTFIEFSSSEKSRLKDIISALLPSHRHGCSSFSARYCWTEYVELCAKTPSAFWERGMVEGGRDTRSRLMTVPWCPQFRRFIPHYLDHSSSVEEEKNGKDSSDNTTEGTGEESPLRRGTTFDMMKSSRNLLKAGNIKIVDITKKSAASGSESEFETEATKTDTLHDSDSFIEGDGSLMFPDRRNLKEGKEVEEVDEETLTTDDQETNEEGDVDENAWSEPIVEGTDDEAFDHAHHNVTSSPLSYPPDCSSSISASSHNRHAGMIEYQFDQCLQVKAEGSRKCTLLLTATHLILEFDIDSHGLFENEELAIDEETGRRKMLEEEEEGGEKMSAEEKDREEGNELHHRAAASMRPKSMRWNLSELSHVYLRRYRLRDSALEMFFIPSGGSTFGGSGLFSAATSIFLDFGAGSEGNLARDHAANCIMRQAPPQTVKQWPERSGSFLHEQLSRLAMAWVEGRLSNFDYLIHLNVLAGRSYNDLCQYPVMPWVLSNYTSEEVPDLNDRSNFRDLTKPMGALNPERLEEFLDRFDTFSDPTIPPFMYGSHYSTSAGVVLHFNVRLHPYAGLHRQLQGGNFDVADRLFSSVPRTYSMCTGRSAAEVKELTPEWYSNPAFLKNVNDFKLGVSQDGELLGDVILPPWAKGSPEQFIEVMRNALESDICSSMLPDWIDLIFGRKQQGPESVKANNVFFYLTYYGSVDVASIEDEALRTATELQIAHFGQCPMQLFWRPHIRRQPRARNPHLLSFYQMISSYTLGSKIGQLTDGEENDTDSESARRASAPSVFLPFFSAPLSHWVHLQAPPPGPHSALIAVRLAGTDRCLAVDSKGIFHTFRWAWKTEDLRQSAIEEGREQSHHPADSGWFVAQRELPNFRAVPRLPYAPAADESSANFSGSVANVQKRAVVAVSKTLFAGRTLLLVLSDGDGRGALALQLMDPYKGVVKGEAIVPCVHSGRITCIAMDPMGTAAGQGGVGGELAIVGSVDGCASLWRFISSQFLPLRPRLRMRGHNGSKIHAVALNSFLNVCASVSDSRCCLFNVGNGAMLRSFVPSSPHLGDYNIASEPEAQRMVSVFADTPAACLSTQGYIVLVTKTTVFTGNKVGRTVTALSLYSLEGVHIGSRPLESWRGVPHKISASPDGTAVMVCSGRGVTIHRISCIHPLEFIDEWHITELDQLDENIPMAYDVDFGPSLAKPVVAAVACSSGALRLHALQGISEFSERYKKSNVSAVVGSALAKPARKIKSAVGKGVSFGSRFVGLGKEIGKEAISDVKEKGVGGFIGGVIFRKGK